VSLESSHLAGEEPRWLEEGLCNEAHKTCIGRYRGVLRLKTGAVALVTNSLREKEQYDMKYLKIAFGLMLVAGLMAVTAGSASAEEYRSVGCIEHAGAGHWEDAECAKAKVNGNWETKEPASGTEITVATIPGKGLVLEDTGAGTAIECEGGGTAKLLAKGTGEQTAASASKCKFIKAGSCEASKPISTIPVHLPWKTKAEEVGSEDRNAIESSGVGEPGYAVECTVAGIFKVTDTCEGKTNTSLVRRTGIITAGEGTEEGAFDAKSPALKCSVGGAGTGVNKGIILLRLKGVPVVLWWILRITR
jgi:hypothetical protein